MVSRNLPRTEGRAMIYVEIDIAKSEHVVGVAAIVKHAGINPSISQSGKFSSDGNHIIKRSRPTCARSIWP